MLLLVRDIFLFSLTIGGLALPFIRFLPTYSPLERVSLGLGAALVTVYLFATLVYLTGVDPRWHWLVPFAGLLGGICFRTQMAELGRHPMIRAASLGWLMLTVWSLGLTALIASYAGGNWAGDWHEHYERTRFFLEHWPEDYRFITIYPLPARPPLINLVTGALLALGSPDYSRYQVITCLLCTLTYFPLLTISRMFGGGSLAVALLAPALMLNPFFVQNATFAWTKLPAAFFVLVAIPLLVRSLRETENRLHLYLAALALAASTLVHYSGAVWIIALGVGWFLASRGLLSYRAIFSRILASSLAALPLLATWFGWALVRYGAHITFGSNTTVLGSQQMNPGSMLAVFGHNLLRSVVPHPFLPVDDPWRIQADPLAVLSDWFFHLYQETLPLTCGSAGLLLAICICFRAPAVKPSRERFFWWGGLSLAGMLGIASVTTPYPWGLVHVSLQPMVLLALVWLTVHLPTTWRTMPALMRTVILTLGLIDFIGGVLLHFIIQHEVMARFDQLSFPARTNFAGKIRLGQPFLSDVLAAPPWILGFALTISLGLAGWQVLIARQSPHSVPKPAGSLPGKF